MSCATCRHFFRDEKRSECRRFPPTVQLVPMARALDPSRAEIKPLSVFPPVAPEASCGEYDERVVGVA